MEKVKGTDKKKLVNLFEKKQQEDGLETNPSNIIWNSTLPSEEHVIYEV